MSEGAEAACYLSAGKTNLIVENLDACRLPLLNTVMKTSIMYFS